MAVWQTVRRRYGEASSWAFKSVFTDIPETCCRGVKSVVGASRVMNWYRISAARLFQCRAIESPSHSSPRRRSSRPRRRRWADSLPSTPLNQTCSCSTMRSPFTVRQHVVCRIVLCVLDLARRADNTTVGYFSYSFRECCSRCRFQPYDCVIICFVE